MTFRFAVLLLALATAAFATPPPDALLVVVSDVHSAYDRYATFLARVDRLRTENPGVPLAILVDGDMFEAGNALSRRTDGSLDFTLLRELARRAPTVLTIGNHEPDLFGLDEVIRRLREVGVVVISGNAINRATGQPFTAASTDLRLGHNTLTVVGVTTDSLSTFRAAVRPTLNVLDPAAWAKDHLAALLPAGSIPVVLSHAGLRGDRPLLRQVPDGTLLVGAHDHLQFVHRVGGTVYFQSGSWLECLSVVALRTSPNGHAWEVTQVPLRAEDPAEPKLAAEVRSALASKLTPEETAVVGECRDALSPAESARFAVESARQAAAADVGLIGATTFGGGLPAGPVSRYAFDGCVRFDGTLCTAEVDGAQLKRILARTNQGPDTPFEQRQGENLVATGVTTAAIVPEARYRIVTTDWVARNAAKFLGPDAPSFTETTLHLKPAVLARLTSR